MSWRRAHRKTRLSNESVLHLKEFIKMFAIAFKAGALLKVSTGWGRLSGSSRHFLKSVSCFYFITWSTRLPTISGSWFSFGATQSWHDFHFYCWPVAFLVRIRQGWWMKWCLNDDLCSIWKRFFQRKFKVLMTFPNPKKFRKPPKPTRTRTMEKMCKKNFRFASKSF